MENGQHKAQAGHEPVMLDGSFLPVAFRHKSKQVARDIVQYVCSHDDADPPPNRACQIMRHLVDDTLKERHAMMQSMVSRLELTDREQLACVEQIAGAMFDDEVVNWGRIVTLHAFCAYLARYCEEGMFPDTADNIADILSQVMINRLGLWIVTNGGWQAYEKQFPNLFWFDAGGLWKAVILLGLLVGCVIVFYSSVIYMSNGVRPF